MPDLNAPSHGQPETDQQSEQDVPWLRPLFWSALTVATVLAVVLNLVLKLGGTRSKVTSVISGEG
jgi:xanthine/uracil permease